MPLFAWNKSYSNTYADILYNVIYNPQLEKEQSFQEFLAVHQKRTQVPTWANDTAEGTSVGVEKKEEEKKQKAAVRDDYLNFDSDESEEFSDAEDDEGADEEGKQGKNFVLTSRQSQMILWLSECIIVIFHSLQMCFFFTRDW